MLNISRLAVLAALLTIGAAALTLPSVAYAQDNCSRTAPDCPPDDPNDPGDPGDNPDDPDDPNDPGDPGDNPDDPDDPNDPGDPGDNPDDPDDPDDPNDPGDPGDDPGDPGDDPGNPGDEPDGPLSWDEKVGELAIDCAIKDDQPITNDFWVVNVGTQILPAGTMIRWRVPATGEHGAFLLPKDIPVGEERVLVDFLADVPIGSECRIQIIA